MFVCECGMTRLTSAGREMTLQGGNQNQSQLWEIGLRGFTGGRTPSGEKKEAG